MANSEFWPPEKYHEAELSTHLIEAGSLFYRIYDASRPIEQAVHYGTYASNRFDDPNQEVGVCYLGTSLGAAIVETVLHSQPQMNFVPIGVLESKAVVEVIFEQDLHLVSYNGNDLKRNSTTSEIFTCQHEYSQKWAEAIIENRAEYPGVFYPCRHNNTYYSVAIFEGRAPIKKITPIKLLSELNETYQILIDHDVGVS